MHVLKLRCSFAIFYDLLNILSVRQKVNINGASCSIPTKPETKIVNTDLAWDDGQMWKSSAEGVMCI